MSRNLLVRTAVAAIFGPLIIWIGYRGGWWLFGMVFLFATLGMLEFLRAERLRLSEAAFWLALVAQVAVLTVTSVAGYGQTRFTPVEWYASAGGLMMVAFFIISGMVLVTGGESAREMFWKHARLLWGVAYIGLLYPTVYLLGELEPSAPYTFSGGDCLLFLFGILWVGDTAAMGVGKWIGRHKLAPAVSPGKTIEGFLAGTAGALLVGLLMIFWRFQSLDWLHVLALAFGCSIFGQLGDLVESMWKRSLGLKDSSAIIPGHGGVLDRFDSLLFAAPFMFWYLNFVFLT